VTRAALKARETEWTRELAALQSDQVQLRARFDALPVAATDRGVTASAVRRRAAAVLDGSRQSLVDIEMQMHQVGPRVEAALVRGGDAGKQALDEESARMESHFQAMRQGLEATQLEVAAAAE